jgi:GTPase KRas
MVKEADIQKGEGFLMVYSITSRNSFELVNYIHQNVAQVKNQDIVPMVLVGNKCDRETLRQVSVNGT